MIDELRVSDIDTAVLLHQYFTRIVPRSSRRLVFVWTRRAVPTYRPVTYDFFVVADGRLWPVWTDCDLVDGYAACMDACLENVFQGDAVGSVWREEYVLCERSIVRKYEGE